MKKTLGMILFTGMLAIGLVVAASVYSASATEYVQGKDGIRSGHQPDDVPGTIDFEPPKFFEDAYPLEIWASGDTGAHFVVGHGAVLDVSTFFVTGYSEPNALAWNSFSTNADGSTPALPAVIRFDPPVQNISMKVGSTTYSGSAAKMKALNATLGRVGYDSVVLSSTMQTLSISSGSSNIEYLLIMGPNIMVADDLDFN